jgi:hypothetical protein
MMETRRKFLTKSASLAAIACGVVNSSAFTLEGEQSTPGTQSSAGASSLSSDRAVPTLRAEDVLDSRAMMPRGSSYQAVVPDTLDLAQRARLSVNNLTHNVDPNEYYYVFQAFNFSGKSKGLSYQDRTLDITAKNLRALPWMRTMSGSDQSLDRQLGMMKTMLGTVGADGLIYYPTEGYRIKGTSYPMVNGIFALACENHYAMDGNVHWLDWIQLIGSGLDKVAIRVEDRAYYPPESTVTPDGKWVWNTRGIATLPYTPPEEPYLDSQGLEGCVKFEQQYAMRALVRAYRYQTNPKILDLIRALTIFDLKLGLWQETALEGVQGNEHGNFYGHFHGNTAPLLALLDIAELENNPSLKELVREGYEHALSTGASRMGWFPSWFLPVKYQRDEVVGRLAEGCAVGEMAELGVRLTDGGLGDYWDQVDSIVRNQLVEQQFSNLDVMKRFAGSGPASKYVEDYLGGFGEASPIGTAPEMYGCCSANTPMGLYYAWHGITRFSDGVATVNLFLNRASAWMDVASFLPYEGKVELRNKQARTALVRIPMWVDPDDVKSYVNDERVRAPLTGRYLVFEGLRNGTVIRLKFPNPEFKEHYWLAGTRHDVVLRGSTVIDVSPGSKDPSQIPLYQRDRYKSNSAPSQKVTYFVADKVLPLQ